jgi:hypothetical protein
LKYRILLSYLSLKYLLLNLRMWESSPMIACVCCVTKRTR